MGKIQLKTTKRIQRFFLWIWRQEGTPTERSIGMALGIFSGCFPLFGLQTLIGVFLASLFKGNRLLAILGTWVSNPFTYIPLYWLNYKVGSFFLGPVAKLPDFTDWNKADLLNQGWMFSLRIFLGSTLVGLIFGLSVGLALFYLLKKSSSLMLDSKDKLRF